jgi:hypothetical protein
MNRSLRSKAARALVALTLLVSVINVRTSNAYGDSSGPETPLSFSGPSVRVNDDTGTTAQRDPDVAFSGDGAAYAAWTDARLASAQDVYYSRRDPASGSWSVNERVNAVTTGSQQFPTIAVDSSNDVYAVWTDYRHGTGDPDIYFSKRSAATGTWSTSVRVNDDNPGYDQDRPRIALSSTGEAIAVWEDNRGRHNQIYSARLPAGSSVWSPSFKISTSNNSIKIRPDISIGSNGVAYAVWSDNRGGSWNIWTASLPAGSLTWSTNTQVSDSATDVESYSEVGVDTSGNVMVAWRRLYNNSASTEVRVRRRPAGSSTWDPVLVLAQGAENVSLAVRGDGRAYVAWRGTGNIRGAEYNPGANTWGSEETVSDATADKIDDPTVAISSTQVLVLWEAGPQTGLNQWDLDIRARSK